MGQQIKKILTANMGGGGIWAKLVKSQLFKYLFLTIPIASGHQLNFLIAKAGEVSQLSFLASSFDFNFN